MHCFYIEPPEGGAVALPPEEAKHAAKVLRLRPGDELCAMDGAGRRWRAALMEAGRVRLIEALPDNEAPVRLTVYEGLPKADKLDFIAQKLTELGAAALVPARMERCVVKLDARDGAKRRERLAKIAREAAKQCRRGLPMAVSEPLDWRAALERMKGHDLLLIPWEEAVDGRLSNMRSRFPDARDIGVVVGPEGGIAPEEVEAMRQIGGRTVTLGPRILRTETAAVVSAALVMGLWGDV